METLNLISEWVARVLDYPLGWILLLPRDVSILIVGIGTSLLLTFTRKWTSDQKYLALCKQDLARLKHLRREVKRAGVKEAVARIRSTVAMIKLVGMKAEGKPLLASILPIALLAIWALARLDYYAPQPGEPLTVRAYYPLSSVSTLTHLVVPDGVTLAAETDAIRFVEVDKRDEANGLVEWIIVPPDAAESLTLTFCHQGETATHEVTVGGHVYAPPLKQHTGKFLMTEVDLKQAKFFGIVPGIDLIFFPPWLVAYLIIAVIFVPILRWMLHVY